MVGAANRLSLQGLVVGSLLVLGSVKGMGMEKIHVNTPEAQLFLETAIGSVNEYVAAHGRCPVNWADMEITYVNGPYRVTDPGISPTPEMGARWRPRRSSYDYDLHTLADGRCRIVAVNRAGGEEMFIESGMTNAQPMP
jgi:hypothetical protein